jgi:hypothetical protein
MARVLDEIRKAIQASGKSRCRIAQEACIAESQLSRLANGERGMSIENWSGWPITWGSKSSCAPSAGVAGRKAGEPCSWAAKPRSRNPLQATWTWAVVAQWHDHTGRRLLRSTRTTDRAAAERILAKGVAGPFAIGRTACRFLVSPFSPLLRLILSGHVAAQNRGGEI